MEAKAYPLSQILAFERRYVIPTYQRDYEWTREGQWQLLFDDLEQVADRLGDARARARAAKQDVVKADKEVGPHFLGAIVIDQLPASAGAIDVRAVIDGQQRLTTLQLLIRGLLDALTMSSQRTAQLKRLLRNPEYTGTPDEQYKLWPRRRDRDAWRLAMAEPADPANNHIYLDARRYFAQRARTYVGLVDASDERTLLLVDAVLGLFRLVVIDLEDNDDAQVIFEVLNGRQTPLSAADLVKNLLFLRAEMVSGANLEEIYDKYWAPFDDPWWKREVGRGHAARRHSDMLLAAWLTAAKEEESTAGRLYGEIRAYLDKSGRSVTDVLAEISQFAAEYRVINGLAPEQDRRTREAYERLNVLGVTTATPLLLWLRMQRRAGMSVDDHRRSVVAVESFVVRRLLIGAQTRGYGRAFAQVLGNLQEASRGDPGHVADKLEVQLRKKPNGAHWPSDNEVVAACTTRRFYGVDSQQRLRLILGAVDAYLRRNNPKTEQATFDYEDLTIEHIMPQTWRPNWPVSGATEAEAELASRGRDAAVDRLGNLTLVTESLNPSLSNGPWPTKRAALSKHSALVLNAGLANAEKWDEVTIQQRGTSLAKTACLVWPRPPVLDEDELVARDSLATSSRSASFEWARIDAAVVKVPAGYWTSYGELAELGGTSSQTVGSRMGSANAPSNAYRVLDRLGRISPSFHWADPTDKRNIREVLEHEGLHFDADGRAEPERRLTAYQLAQQIPELFSEDELERLAKADEARKTKVDAEGHGPWLDDGVAWHFNHNCSEKTRSIAEKLIPLIQSAIPTDMQPDWGQRYYVAWRVGSRIWLRVITKRSFIGIQFRKPSLTTEAVAEKLAGVAVPPGSTPSIKAAGPIQVELGKYWPVKVRFRNLSDVTGEGAQRLHRLIEDEWKAFNARGAELAPAGSDVDDAVDEIDEEDAS